MDRPDSGDPSKSPSSPQSARAGIAYGRHTVDLTAVSNRMLGMLMPRQQAACSDAAETIRRSLQAPLGASPLRDLARGARRVSILISARDRVTRSDQFVRVLADELNAAGVPDERVAVHIAAGTHHRQTDDDILSLVGPEIVRRLHVQQHDPRDAANLADLGTTSFGTPIAINRQVYESDVKILTGRIAHHYFAGFSGGRKAIAPGISGLQTIMTNHKRVMKADGTGRHPAACAGRLADNPVHLDMLEIARAAGPSFCLNTVLDTKHDITHVFAGDYLAVHEAGCAEVAASYDVAVTARADLTVASCGGWPFDLSFMQVIKTIVSAERTVADDGVLVVLGECERGIEPGFLEWFDGRPLEALSRAVVAQYTLKGHNSYWIQEIERRIRLVLVSNLSADDVRALGMLPARNLDEALDIACGLLGVHVPFWVVPHGNVTVFHEDLAVDRDAPPPVGCQPVRAEDTSGFRQCGALRYRAPPGTGASSAG